MNELKNEWKHKTFSKRNGHKQNHQNLSNGAEKERRRSAKQLNNQLEVRKEGRENE